VVDEQKILLRRLATPSVEWSSVRGLPLRGLSIMHHDIWNAITNANPALAGTILVAGIIGVLAWIWWPGGFLLP
jgi:hypothetical protein